MHLPAHLTALGLTSRPMTKADAEECFRVTAAQERHDLGSVEIELADIIAEWQRPSFDIEASTIAVFDGTKMVGYAEISGGERGEAAVDPAYAGRGIGTFLAQWMQDAARRHGYLSVRMPVFQGSPGDRLLEALGYDLAWEAWVLQLPAGVDIPRRALPEGYHIRTAQAADDVAVWTVLEDAFLEWSVRERESLEDFQAETRQRPGFQDWNSRVVTDPTGEVVGAAIVLLSGEDDEREVEAWVDRIAVRRDQRGQGLAQALLADCFDQARAHGAQKSGLSTDSRTGALDLYRKVGMEVTSVWVNRAISL